ncbi:deoxynucleoside kinase [Mycoplasma buteonis]|uniref:deoxynucleoside kinase n=1 Tax=Mycoplasma buteonis TaxID=171280 RepID=UPI000563527B|nr:deoxynucleoside kinase [Mycoplasma buteonis]
MLIGISGMIGSGKSVLSEKLKDFYNDKALLLQEFSEEDEVFNTMLQWLYQRKPNFDLTFQVYAIEHHLGSIQKIKDEFNRRKMNPKNDLIVIDRFVAEHYVFSKINLKNAQAKIQNAYNSLFNTIVQKEDLPEVAIFLDVTFDNFKKRLFKRGREVEIQTWDKNEPYFYELLSIYKSTFIEVVKKLNIKYEIIDTNNKTEDEVFYQAVSIIKKYQGA